MRTSTAIGLLAQACLGCRIANAAYNTVMEVATCAEMQAAAAALVDGDVLAMLTEDYITCDTWTDINISQNKLKLDSETLGKTFTNARFVVSDGAVLRAEMLLALDGSEETQTVNGGVLHVEDGGKARFLGDVYVRDAAVMSTEDEMVHGGCIYNEGYIRFEANFIASRCKTVAADGATPGNGGALYIAEGGKVVAKEEVWMGNNGSAVDAGWAGNSGGAIFNAGKMTYFAPFAYFTGNIADQGGAIYNTGEMKFLKRVPALFNENRSIHNGGHLYNEGTVVLRNRGSFVDGYAGGGGGAIYNQGDAVMTFIKDVTFEDNSAEGHGGAIYMSYEAVDYLPEDAVYTRNRILNADADFYCNDVYVNGELEDDYTCLP